ncbi:sensor histidine kinase [Lapidilactobacillus wuchangensis]|uniref:sensor histidine kinase n=1 Tax=Lapidilactobacillus wuchangensis TaxID=2486001 RepID=UPI000F77297B|nr:GHKL domain-containing protein [Lapidilactobacillus wuchangensis]
MVELSAYAHFGIEAVNLVLLMIAIGICTGNRSREFYLIFGLLIIPLTFLSLTDFLLAGIAITGIFGLLRFAKWRLNKGLMINDILGFLIALSIYLVVTIFASSVTIILLRPTFNTLITNGAVIVLLNSLISTLLFAGLLFFVKKKFLSLTIAEDEQRIYILQIAVFIGLAYAFGEIMRLQHVLGIYIFIMIGFLVAQTILSVYFTYMMVKKNHERIELQHLQQQIEIMNAYTEEVDRNYQEMRQFRHDYRNLLLALKLDPSSSVANQKYLDQILSYSEGMARKSVMRFSDLSNLEMMPLKSLIITKLSQAEQSGLKVRFECLDQITLINLAEVKLIRVVGILLDNAIEAAVNSQDKLLRILFIRNKNNLEISIENSFNGTIPALSIIHQVGFSSKGKGRGLGLTNVDEMIKNETNTELIQYVAEQLFVASLLIKDV